MRPQQHKYAAGVNPRKRPGRARVWEISEQRYEQLAEYAKLAKEKREEDQAARSGQPDKRYEERGDSLASRDLGIPRATIQRAQEYAVLPEAPTRA